MRNESIRSSVRTLYDMQKIRIQSGNRIAAAFRVKLGLDSSQAEEENEKAVKVLTELRTEYQRITDGVKRITKNMTIDSPLITSWGELALIQAYDHQLQAEATHEKIIQDALLQTPIWQSWLSGVKGIGPLMGGVILSEVDIEKCNQISELWAYAGLDVVLLTDDETGEVNGEGRSRKAHHLVPRTYKTRNGETIETRGITFNPFLKTKLIGVLGSSFIKQTGSTYREIYDNYKHRLVHHPAHKKKSKGHRHNMAVRYMIKIFLQDLWLKWRALEGLPITEPYCEGKLGIKHSESEVA